MPSFFQVLGHMYFPCAVLVGPQFSMTRYMDLVKGTFGDKLTGKTTPVVSSIIYSIHRIIRSQKDRPKKFELRDNTRIESFILWLNEPEKIIRVKRWFELYDFELRGFYCMYLYDSESNCFIRRESHNRTASMMCYTGSHILLYYFFTYR